MGAKQMKHIREFSLFESKINAIRVEIPYETYEKDSNGHYTKNRIKGKSKIIDYADRKIVLFDINGIRIPFYLSSGHAGKKDVAAGKWYPFLGNS
jgi:ppGpp synthetase/RelA/SpoT-type nucleotidyltranferase